MGNPGIPMTGCDRQTATRGGHVPSHMQSSVEDDHRRLMRVQGRLQREIAAFPNRRGVFSPACGQRRRQAADKAPGQQLRQRSLYTLPFPFLTLDLHPPLMQRTRDRRTGMHRLQSCVPPRSLGPLTSSFSGCGLAAPTPFRNQESAPHGSRWIDAEACSSLHCA